MAPFDAECNRFENGIRTSGAQGCSAQLDTHIFDYIQTIRPRRFIVVDEERQTVFGNFMFNHPGDITWVNVPGQGRREMIGAAEAAVRRGCGGGVPDQGPQDPQGRGADGEPAVRGDVAVRAAVRRQSARRTGSPLRP